MQDRVCQIGEISCNAALPPHTGHGADIPAGPGCANGRHSQSHKQKGRLIVAVLVSFLGCFPGDMSQTCRSKAVIQSRGV
jgi:hypothetical protein